MWTVITEEGIVGEYDSKKEANRVYNEEKEYIEMYARDVNKEGKPFAILCKIKKEIKLGEEGIEETRY